MADTSCDDAINIYTDGASAGNPGPADLAAAGGAEARELDDLEALASGRRGDLYAITSHDQDKAARFTAHLAATIADVRRLLL